VLAERARAEAAQAEAAVARAEQSDAQALIAHLKLQIEKLRREIYGQRFERSVRLLDQMELQLEELEATATEDELKAEQAAAKTTPIAGSNRRRSAYKPFPAHLRASGWLCPARRVTPAAVEHGCRSWARISPRHWRPFRGSGR
jgi:hypothetical protein